MANTQKIPFADDDKWSLNVINNTDRNFEIVFDQGFMNRHSEEPRLKTAYYILLDGKRLDKGYTSFNICNSLEVTITAGKWKGTDGYLITEKDDEDMNNYFVDLNSKLTTVSGTTVHFMEYHSMSFATEKVKDGDIVNQEQTRNPGATCCGFH